MEEVATQKNWFRKNWFWFIPVSGCLLSVTAVSILIFIGLYNGYSVLRDLTQQISTTMPIDEALKRIDEYEYIQQALGPPIQAGSSRPQFLEILNDEQHIKTQTRIEGQRESATLFVSGEKIDGQWVYHQMYIILDSSGEEIELMFDDEK